MKKGEKLTLNDILESLDKKYLSIIMLTLQFQDKERGGLRCLHYRYALIGRDGMADNYWDSMKRFFQNHAVTILSQSKITLLLQFKECIAIESTDVTHLATLLNIPKKKQIESGFGFGSGASVMIPEIVKKYIENKIEQYDFIEKCFNTRGNLIHHLNQLVELELLEVHPFDDNRYRIKEGNDEFFRKLHHALLERQLKRFMNDATNEQLEEIIKIIEKKGYL